MLKKPFFSIVIPTLNEEKYLPLLLSDLAEQTLKDFEVIHVDGYSEDKTVKEASKWKRKIYLITEKTKVRNVSVQRNLGGKKARGQWIIFMDADNRLPKYFLQGIRYRLDKSEKTDAFSTFIKVEEKTAKYQSIETAINLNMEMLRVIKKEVAFGAMIGVKKEIFNKIKFDETQKVVEDSIFIQEITKAGYKFSLFRDPFYYYSMRRIESEGTMKMALIASQLAINFLQGKKFSEKDFGYIMKGGKYYEKIKTSPFRNLISAIENTSEKQLNKLKELINKGIEF